MSQMDDIIDGNVDIYHFLEVGPEADKAQIRKQYRKKALIYHPDKNDGEEAKQKFQLLSAVYEILMNDGLRKKYDDMRQSTLAKTAQHEKRQRFREELRRAEMASAGFRARTSAAYDDLDREFRAQVRRDQRAEKLREEGLRLRRQHEARLHAPGTPKKAYISYRDIDIGPRKYVVREAGSSGNRVLVQWKHKPELKGMVDLEVVRQMMAIFGPVKLVRTIDRSGQRYDAAVVEFADGLGARAAAEHDYRQSARLWDGTPVRKLASLLRECQRYCQAGQRLDLR